MTDGPGRAAALAAREVFRALAPQLKGHPSEIQGAALAEAVALWLAGHHRDVRTEAREMFIKLVDDLVPPSIEQMRATHPEAPPDFF